MLVVPRLNEDDLSSSTSLLLLRRFCFWFRLFVFLQDYRKNYWQDFLDSWKKVEAWAKEEPIKFLE